MWMDIFLSSQGRVFRLFNSLNFGIQELPVTVLCAIIKQGLGNTRARDWVGVTQKEYLPLSRKCDHFGVSCIQILV